MTKITHRLEIYKSRQGWRWRVRSVRNRKIVACSGEGMSSKRTAFTSYLKFDSACTLGKVGFADTIK